MSLRREYALAVNAVLEVAAAHYAIVNRPCRCPLVVIQTPGRCPCLLALDASRARLEAVKAQRTAARDAYEAVAGKQSRALELLPCLVPET